MANIKVQVIEFRPVKVEYEVEALTIQEALNKVADGEGGVKKIISMPDMTDDPYEIDEESFWQVDVGDGFEYVHDIGDVELEKEIV